LAAWLDVLDELGFISELDTAELEFPTGMELVVPMLELDDTLDVVVFEMLDTELRLETELLLVSAAPPPPPPPPQAVKTAKLKRIEEKRSVRRKQDIYMTD
jgi:hypothetical protein